MDNEKTINSRLIATMNRLGLKKSEFARLLEVSHTSINNYMVRGVIPSVTIIETLLSKHPNINARWLLTGEGNMFYEVEEGNEEPLSKNNYQAEGNMGSSYLQNRIQELEYIIELQKKLLNRNK